MEEKLIKEQMDFTEDKLDSLCKNAVVTGETKGMDGRRNRRCMVNETTI